MDERNAIKQSVDLVQKSKIAFLGTKDQSNYPNIKAMLNLESNGLEDIWFSTNTSSRRVKDILNDPKACVYYVDQENFKGLMLVGEIEVLQDEESRKKLWFDGCEKYYPKGVNDPDYSVLHFKAQRGNFYHGLENVDFIVDIEKCRKFGDSNI